MQFHEPLAPVNPPIALFGRHVYQSPMTLTVFDDMFYSGDDYVVSDSEGNTIIRANAQEWSHLQKKAVYNDAMQPIGEIRDKQLTLHSTVELVGEGGNVLIKAEQRADFGAKHLFRVKLGDKLELSIVGDWKLRTVEFVTGQGAVVARGSSDNAPEVNDAKNMYKIDVAPGVDLALVAVVCICVDTIRKNMRGE